MAAPFQPVPEPTLLSAPLRVANKLARRLDGWMNAVTGLGGMTTDRAAAMRFETGGIPDQITVDAIYQHDWLADRIIEKMPSIALVRGFTVEGAGGKPDALIRDFEELNTSERFPGGAFQKAVYDGRAYGCAGLFLGYKLGNPEESVEPDSAVARGGLAFLDVVAQHELRAVTRYENPSSPKFGMPEIYEILGTATGIPHPRRGQRFHESRLLRFLGKPLRTANHPLGNFPELGVSVLTPVLQDIARYGTSWAAVSHLLQDASIGVMKIGGLVEALASEDKAIVEDRLAVLQRTKSLNRLMFLDADANEEFSRVQVSFSDLPGVMAQIILSISGAADMPAKILFGTSPMGLNANSAGIADLEQFYNSVDEYRRRTIGPKLETVLRAISGNTDVRVKFPALWQPSENEQAQTRLTNANATRAYWDMGAVQATDVLKGAKEGLMPETIGTPSDERAPDPEGEGQEPPPPGPQGSPGARLAAALASAGRRADATEEDEEDADEDIDPEHATKELARLRKRFESALTKYERRREKFGVLEQASVAAEAAQEKAYEELSVKEEAVHDLEIDLSEAEGDTTEISNKLEEAKKAHQAAEKAVSKAEKAFVRAQDRVEKFQPDIYEVRDRADEWYGFVEDEFEEDVGERLKAEIAAEVDGHIERITRTQSDAEFKNLTESEEEVPSLLYRAAKLAIEEGRENPKDRRTVEEFENKKAEHEKRMVEIGPRGGRYYTSVTGRRIYVRADSTPEAVIQHLAQSDPEKLVKLLEKIGK